MEALIFLLCLLIGGSTASECEGNQCNDAVLKEWGKIDYKPNEADLRRLCPSTLEYFNCFEKNIKECTGKDVEEYIESLEEFGRIIARSLWNSRNLAVELCDEDSTLRRDYLANVDCYVGMVNDADFACRESAESDIEAFLRQHHNLSEDDNINWKEMFCLKELYELACLADKLEDTCSEAGRKAYLKIREIINPSLNTECEVEDPQSLRRSFLEHLGLVGKKAEIFRFVFERFGRE